MVETPRLDAKQNMGKCYESEHKPTPVLSYSRKRVSRKFLVWFPAFAGTGLDPCFRRNDDQAKTETEVDLLSDLTPPG